MTLAPLPDLAETFRAARVNVREIDLWRSRVRPGLFTPVGIIVHHTADKGTGDSGLGVLIHGHSTLVGPLCTASPREDGRLALISAGRANHAGMGSGVVLGRVRRDLAPLGTARAQGYADTTIGNGWFYGFEVDNDGTGQPYPPEQISTTILSCAALCVAHGWTENRVILHSEWTRRKVDWSAMTGPETRALVKVAIAELRNSLTIPVPFPEEADYVIPPNVQKGDTGKWVKKVQGLLLAHGHPLHVDGDFGNQTQAAMLRHQRAHRLPVSGVADKATWRTLIER